MMDDVPRIRILGATPASPELLMNIKSVTWPSSIWSMDVKSGRMMSSAFTVVTALVRARLLMTW